MTLHTYRVCAYCMCTLFGGADTLCDSLNCVLCNTDGTCAQCKDGYFIINGYCFSCQEDCFSCTDYNHCKVCDDGFFTFQSDSYTSCNNCPTNCVKCNSTTFCSECKSGYYSKSCGASCNMCKDGACSKTDCTHGCIDGYHQLYLSDNYGYCSVCTPNCKSCTNGSYCNVCHDGYYLINYGVGIACTPCYPSCKSCSSPSLCDSCPPGRWTLNCESYCQDGCKNSTCDISTGLCNEGCTEGYDVRSDGVCYPCSQSSSGCHCPEFQYYNGNTCVPCTAGFWGRLCNESCNSNCLDGKCDVVNGHCDKCNQTHFGHFCEYNCNNKCINAPKGSSICDNNGGCLFGCHNGFVGPSCNKIQHTSVTTIQQTSSSMTSADEALTTTELPVGQTEAMPQAGNEDTVPVGIIAGAVGVVVFILLVTGAAFAFIFMMRRNDPSFTDNASASRTDPSYENTPDNIGGMSTYTDLSHVSGEETPYSTMTRTEYENVNVCNKL